MSVGEEFYYLSVIQDLYNNEIVSWELFKRNDLELVLNTVEKWTKKKDATGGSPFRARLPVYVKAIQQPIRVLRHQGQPLSKRKLAGQRLFRIVLLTPQNRETVYK